MAIALPGIVSGRFSHREVILWRPAAPSRDRGTRLFVMLDGQNAVAWGVPGAVASLAEEGRPIAVAAVPSSGRRTDELGMSRHLDYAGRGRLAGAFQQYLSRVVLPAAADHLGRECALEPAAIFGASLGGLCALDTAWHNDGLFGSVGVFSGALWWRGDNSNPAAQQAGRLMHRQVRASRRRRALRCWLQAGTLDEVSDRDRNGVIDAIQDTTELIEELENTGLKLGRDLAYLQVEGGRHDEGTWAAALPSFLRWAWSGAIPQGH